MYRRWAFWRRFQYATGLILFFGLIGSFWYYTSRPPVTCFDGLANGDERGVDCGGTCVRICALDLFPAQVLWAQSFKVIDGQYNAVAYIENKNPTAGIESLTYTFSFYDSAGRITERSGTTVLPPDSVYPIFEGRVLLGDRVPTRTMITLGDDPVWVPAVLGRDQFVIEDRSLSNSDTAPRLDARIANRALFEAQDVEVVATIFDISGNPLTASRTVIPFLGAKSSQDITFTWPQGIARTLRSCEVPTDVVLAIDLSGSMNDDGGTPPEPISSVLAAARTFVERLSVQDQISVVRYATDAEVAQPLTTNKQAAAASISTLTITAADEVGSTNIGAALSSAEGQLNGEAHNPNARKVLVLLTDGLATAPQDDPEGFARSLGELVKQTGVNIFAIGLGDAVNDAFLSSIASQSENYFKAGSVETVDGIYETVRAAICEDGRAVIEVIPKTGVQFTPLL